MEKFFAYQKDNRTPCKYGRQCYQKNKEHLDKYKHPPTKVRCNKLIFVQYFKIFVDFLG